MTEICLNLNNFSQLEALIGLFPLSHEYEFTANKVFRLKRYNTCSCGTSMVHNGFDYARKKGFGKVKIGKQICNNCGKQHHEDKSFWKKLLGQWKETTTSLILTLRDSHVSWDVVSKIMGFFIPCSKGKAIDLFNNLIEQFEYPQDNFLIVNYDEQHPRKGRIQKFRLTLLNYHTKIPIAELLADDKDEETIKMFLKEHLDITKPIVIITDCDRKYPRIFKELWGNKVIHQKCLLHLNKLITKDFGKSSTLLDVYNKYILLNIFYNRRGELKFLERLIKKQEKKHFSSSKDEEMWLKKALHKFFDYVKKIENKRRRHRKNLPQRPLWKAQQLFTELLRQQHLFSPKIRKRLHMINDNWKCFTAFYSINGCPATNNAIENYFSTSLKTHRKKQLRSDMGIINHMKLSAFKRVHDFSKPRRTFLEIYSLITLIVT